MQQNVLYVTKNKGKMIYTKMAAIKALNTYI